MTSLTNYPWNVHISIGGVSFYGPGMESELEAESIKNIVEEETDGEVEVIRQ